VSRHVLVKDIQRLENNIYLRKIVFIQGWILILMFAFEEVGQKTAITKIYMFSLPVGYFHAADLSLIGKRNLEPGLELIMLRVIVVC
jgi:hypothetical protein